MNLKYLTSLLRPSLTFVLCGLPFLSCEDDDFNISTGDGSEPNVYQRIDRDQDTDVLITVLGAAETDYSAVLSGEGPFTVFAPSDAAFEDLAIQLGLGGVDELLAATTPALLDDILNYHVVTNRIVSSGLNDGEELTTVAEETITVSTSSRPQILDKTELPQTDTGANIIGADKTATNGVVHLVDKVLLSDAIIMELSIDIRPSILNWAVATEDLSTLVVALDSVSLVGAIDELDEATVFAPNNDAFSDVLEFLGEDYNAIADFDNDVELSVLNDILLYHVVDERIYSEDLAEGEVGTLLPVGDESAAITVVADGDGFILADESPDTAGFVTVDVDGSNGVVHIIDKVLLPQSTFDFLDLLASDDIATLASETADLSILVEALIATDLVDLFIDATNSGESGDNFTYFNEATVFAPTNDAFGALLDLLGDDYNTIADFDTEEELELLSSILTYHVVAGAFTSDDISGLTAETGSAAITTVNGEDIVAVSQLGTGTLVIDDASNDPAINITTPDVEARNGVVHIVDRVLLPQEAVDFILSLED